MRCLVRMGLGLAGLALVASTAAWADPPPSDAPDGAPATPRRASWRKSRLCARCRWEDHRARGLNVPPPPPLPQGGAVTPENRCDRCGGPVATVGGTTSLPVWTSVPAGPAPAPVLLPSVTRVPALTAPPPPLAMVPGPMPPGSMAAPAGTCVQCDASAAPMMASHGGMPGRAVAGGDAPGYVVVGGEAPTGEPMPIGMIQGRYAYQNPGAALGGPGMPMPGGRPGPGASTRGPGSSDPSVMPSSFATEPYLPGRHNRPHILTHLFGLDAIGQHARAERERRARESHAAISYQPQNAPVNELPSSMVYGR